MTDQPLATAKTDIKAIVFKQFTLKWQEFGKASLTSAAAIAVGLLYPAISAGRWPTHEELLVALNAGKFAFIASLARYFMKPTTTVIKGQVDPQVSFKAPTTVITKDAVPPTKDPDTWGGEPLNTSANAKG